MTWAALSIAVVALGFAGTSVALALRVGVLRSERDAYKIERDVALRGLADLSDRRLDLAQALRDRGDELSFLRDELETCGDPATRARIAVDGIARMLSPPDD